MSSAVLKETTENQLPEGWRKVKFGDMAKHISKRVEPSETDLEIYVGLEHLDSDSLRIKRHGVPSDVAGQKLLVKKGQIIFGKRRAYQRKVAVADWDCICSAHAMVLEANPETVIPEYLPYFMQSDVFMNRAVAVSEGSLSPTIKWKVLAQQEFFIPDKSEQRRLLRVLSGAFSSFEDSIKMENSFRDLQRVVSNEISFFRDETVKKVSLGELLSSGDLLEIQDGNHGNDHPKASEYVEDGIPFVMASDFCDGNVNLETCKKLPKGRTDQLRIGFSKPGDVLLTHKGTVGEVAITPEGYDYVMLTPQVTYYRVGKGRILPEFLELCFRSSFFQNMIKQLAAQSTRAYIGITAQKKIKIPVPDKERQLASIVVWENLNSTKRRLQNKKKATSDLYKSIVNNKPN